MPSADKTKQQRMKQAWRRAGNFIPAVRAHRKVPNLLGTTAYCHNSSNRCRKLNLRQSDKRFAPALPRFVRLRRLLQQRMYSIPTLTENEIMSLVVDQKWRATLAAATASENCG
jgi:hypothetical protein